MVVAAEGGEVVVGRRMVMEKWWWKWRSLASSRSGIKWPIPGLGMIITWGCGVEHFIILTCVTNYM